MFENFRVFETEFAGRPLKIETGKLAQLANGSCLVRYGETEVFVAVTASAKPREGIDFFPLSVDFEEKLYAVGRIPGSFLKREGRPSERAILASRLIDRPIRPLFPKDMRNDVSVVCTVMSSDPDCSAEIAAMIGTSCAISISDIPWKGPIGGCVVGYVDGEYVINPTVAQREKSKMHVTVASTDKLVAMIEAGADQVPDDVMFNGIMAAHAENQKIVNFINDITREIGHEKFTFESNDPEPEMFEAIKEFAIEDVRAALDTDDKRVRDERLVPVYESVHAKFDEIYPEMEAKIDECLYKVQEICGQTLAARRRQARRRQRHRRDSPARRRSWSPDKDSWQRPLYKGTDAGAHHSDARTNERRPDPRRHRRRGVEALYAPVQYAVLFGGRDAPVKRTGQT